MGQTPTATIALVGQPNCGKSTLFNALAGYRAVTSNFPGTTVAFTESQVALCGERARIVDLPGTYSLSPGDHAERVTRDFLLSGKADAVVVVLDASVLARSIVLVLQVLEMGTPMVVALNMMDEAARKGVQVDVDALSRELGVPVIPTIATRGKGVMRVAMEALRCARYGKATGRPPEFDSDVEESVQRLSQRMPSALASRLRVPVRWVVLRLLEADELVESLAARVDPEFAAFAKGERSRLAELHHWPEETVLASHRHAVALDLFEAVARVVPRRGPSWSERLDGVLMHPFWGLLGVIVAFAALFGVAFVVGDFLAGQVEGPLGDVLDVLREKSAEGLGFAMVRGLAEGAVGGAGIVLPYLLPLLVMISIYEDTGYLPRAAFLIDGLMHRLGIHGKSVVPLILGYGCSVPGIMGTRILDSSRDRVLTALLVPLVPCSARTVVVLALVGALVGPVWALTLYGINVVVVACLARVLSWVLKGRAGPGLLMDVPALRVPAAAPLLRKVWLRVQEFLVHAWPILVIASVILSVFEFLGLDSIANSLFEPLTSGALGLPAAVGVTLVFGVLRKELALVMLFQALGTNDVASALSLSQIVVFTVFVMYYIPCVASISVLWRELGWRWTLTSAALNLVLAVTLAFMARVVFMVVG